MDELLKMTLTELLQERVRLHGDRLAYRYTDRDYTRTYREFDEETDEIAKGFLAMGLKKGDHIAIWAPNIPEWVLTLFATAKIGGVLVTVNTNSRCSSWNICSSSRIPRRLSWPRPLRARAMPKS